MIKKSVVSMLLVIVLLVTVFIPTIAFAGEDALIEETTASAEDLPFGEIEEPNIVDEIISETAAVEGSAQDDIATEPMSGGQLMGGNSKETATPLPQFNADYSNDLTENSQDQWFKFTTTDYNAYYRVWAKNLGKENKMHFRFYDEHLEILLESKNYWGLSKDDTISSDFNLEKNKTYYLRVFTESTGNFKLNVGYTKDVVGNTVEQAAAISLGKSYSNSSDGIGDIDYFKFTTNSKNLYYSVYVKNYNIGSESYNGLNASLNSQYDDSLDSKRGISNDRYWLSIIKLKKNTSYYIRVEGMNKGNYGFYVKPYKPATPGNKSAKSNSFLKSVEVQWSGVSDATGYLVYRSTSKDKGFKKIDSSSYTYYKDYSKLKNGKVYYYKIRAFRIFDDGITIYSDYSNAKGVRVKF